MLLSYWKKKVQCPHRIVMEKVKYIPVIACGVP
jgi:hypothetical protein